MSGSFDTRKSAILGAALIGLGIVWWLSLWWLLLPGALVAGGVAAYAQRRRIGRTADAVQLGLWGVGLGLLFLIDFVFPGLLFLAGASVLARGREDQLDERVQRLTSGLRGRLTARPRAQMPVSVPPVAQRESVEGETTRL